MTIFIEEFKQNGIVSTWTAKDKADMMSKISNANASCCDFFNVYQTYNEFHEFLVDITSADEMRDMLDGEVDKNHCVFVHQTAWGGDETFKSYSTQAECDKAELNHHEDVLRGDLKACNIYTDEEAIQAREDGKCSNALLADLAIFHPLPDHGDD